MNSLMLAAWALAVLAGVIIGYGIKSLRDERKTLRQGEGGDENSE